MSLPRRPSARSAPEPVPSRSRTPTGEGVEEEKERDAFLHDVWLPEEKAEATTSPPPPSAAHSFSEHRPSPPSVDSGAAAWHALPVFGVIVLAMIGAAPISLSTAFSSVLCVGALLAAAWSLRSARVARQSLEAAHALLAAEVALRHVDTRGTSARRRVALFNGSGMCCGWPGDDQRTSAWWGASLTDTIHKNDRATASRALERVVVTRTARSLKCRRVFADKTLHVVLSFAPVVLHGKPFVAVAEDDLSTAHSMKGKLKDMAAARQRQDQTVAYVCHELRNPLHVISACADLAHTSPSDELVSHVSMIRESAQLMTAVVDDILDLQKLMGEKMRLHPSVTRISDTLRFIVEAYRRRAVVPIELQISPEVAQFVLLDDVRLRQVLSNGVSNATKLTRTGVIIVRCHPGADGRSLVIEVQDSGPGLQGVPSDVLFEAFEQGDFSDSASASSALTPASVAGSDIGSPGFPRGSRSNLTPLSSPPSNLVPPGVASPRLSGSSTGAPDTGTSTCGSSRGSPGSASRPPAAPPASRRLLQQAMLYRANGRFRAASEPGTATGSESGFTPRPSSSSIASVSGSGKHKAGTGLGLTISRKLVGLMQGSLTLADAPNGVGAVFRVVLPLSLPSREQIEEFLAESQATGSAASSPAHRHSLPTLDPAPPPRGSQKKLLPSLPPSPPASPVPEPLSSRSPPAAPPAGSSPVSCRRPENTVVPVSPRSTPVSTPPIPTPPMASSKSSGGIVGANVLVVEDDRMTRVLMGRFLQKCGCSSQQLDDGDAVLSFPLAGGPTCPPVDCIFLDIHMPTMDGRDVCRSLRQRGEDLPIVATTGDGDIDSYLVAGFTAVLQKPFSAAQVEQLLRQLLSREDTK